jgi:hypothetical protein
MMRLGRQAGDVRTETSDIFPFNDDQSHSLSGRVQAMYLPASPLPNTTTSYFSNLRFTILAGVFYPLVSIASVPQ